jgi:predicted site-specific integrase-resolvase
MLNLGEDSYLTPIQASVRTGIAKVTLARWRKDGKGPRFMKRGGRIVYPSTEFEVWLLAWRREQAAGEVGGAG